MPFLAKAQSINVVFNEWSCSNLNQFEDNHSDFGDWFELYNPDATDVNLGGYHLSDDPDEPTKFKIPAGVTIGANGFLRVWASGRNVWETAAGGHLHVNFGLTQTKNKKDDLTLSTPAGGILQTVKVNKTTKLGHSYGRKTDGSSDWVFFPSPTPGGSNAAASSFLRYAKKPDLDIEAGYFADSVTVTLTTDEPGATIHFSLDGGAPDAASATYSAPLTFKTTTVLKAVAVSPDAAIEPSFQRYETYFIGPDKHSIPVVSISAGQDLEFLANGNKDFFPHGSFEFFDKDGKRTAKTVGEFNSHGQDSWVHDQRSIDFVARDEMGYRFAIGQKMFEMTDRDEFQRVILRAAGDDNFPASYAPSNEGSAHMRDAYIQNLAKRGEMHLDVREASKSVVYLNGKYWGVYDLREKPDDHDYTDFNYGQGKYEIQYNQTWGNTWAQYGGQQSLNDWTQLRTYILNTQNSMNDAAKWKYVTDRLDVESLADYVLLNAFTVCSDWLNYNTGWWRGLDSTGQHLKWGYTLWDNDATFAFYINYTDIPDTSATADPCDALTLTNNQSDPQRHIRVLNKLLTNTEFKNWYINRQIDLSNTVFSCENMLHHFDSTLAVITPEMPRHCARWNGAEADWEANVARLRDFIVRRCSSGWSEGIADCYSLTGPHELTIDVDPAGAGHVQLNSLELKTFPWKGQYFTGVPIKVTVTDINPNDGKAFLKWTAETGGAFQPTENSVTAEFNLTAADTVTARFFTTTSTKNEPLLKLEAEAAPTVFAEKTSVKVELPKAARLSMGLFAADGRAVADFSQSRNLAAGAHVFELDFSENGLADGLYFLKIQTDDRAAVLKLVLQK